MNADNHFPPPVPIPLPEEANVQPVEPPTGLPESPPAFDFLDLTSDPTYPPPEAYAEPNVPVVESEPVPPALEG